MDAAGRDRGLQRSAAKAAEPGPILDHPRAVVARYQTLALENREVLLALAVDRDRRLIAERILEGGPDGVRARPRDLLVPVIASGAAGLIVVHNHPSGVPTPSSADLAFTRRLRAAARLCGVALVDHVVVASGGWTSFRASGLLGGGPGKEGA